VLGVRHGVPVSERGARRPLPRDWPAPEQLGEQVCLLLEQPVVVGQVVAEQGKRLDARATAEDHLGSPARNGVERRVALKHAHRVVGARDGDRGAESDPARPRGDRREHGITGRYREVFGAMLADAEEVDPDLIGEHALLDTLRIVWACDSGRPAWWCVRSPNVSRPSTSGNCAGAGGPRQRPRPKPTDRLCIRQWPVRFDQPIRLSGGGCEQVPGPPT
jgi:hypothetical protein